MSNEFRKKPVVIEAFQMTRERRTDNSEWPAWLNEAWNQPRDVPGAVSGVDGPGVRDDQLQIVTLEGVHRVDWDDWIIRGVKGELYPCKPDIFEATYDPAGSSEKSKLSASEAVFGFASWLTTRSERTVMSAADDSAPIATLLGRFCDANHLASPREGWENWFRSPE